MPAANTRRSRKPATRPEAREALPPADPLPATVEIAEPARADTSAAKPALSPEAQERIERERAKLAKEQRAASNRLARIEAMERGEALPTSRGLPPVVKMNELGQTARNLHRAYELLSSDEVAALAPSGLMTSETSDAASCAAHLRDLAISTWEAQYAAREAAGAAGNETLAPLHLVRDAATGVVSLIEKKAKSE